MRLTEAETGPAQVWVTSPRRCCSNRPRLGDGGRTCGASKALDWGTGPQQAGWVCSGITAFIGFGTSCSCCSPVPLSLRAETGPDGEATAKVLNSQGLVLKAGGSGVRKAS